MSVTFAPLLNDGTQLIDGVHNMSVSNAFAAQILTAIGEPTTIPGQDFGKAIYDKVIAFQQSPQGQALTPQQQTDLDKVRIAVAAACRIQSGIIAWR